MVFTAIALVIVICLCISSLTYFYIKNKKCCYGMDDLVILKQMGGIAGIDNKVEISKNNIDSQLWNEFVSIVDFNGMEKGQVKVINENPGNDMLVYSVKYDNKTVIVHESATENDAANKVVKLVNYYVNLLNMNKI